MEDELSEVVQSSTETTDSYESTTDFMETFSSIISSSVSYTTELFSTTEDYTDILTTDSSSSTAFPENVARTSQSSHSTDKLLFSFLDYSLFAIMLGMSALIGVYFGFISKKKQNNTTEYLLGGKKMNFFPIAASLIARF